MENFRQVSVDTDSRYGVMLGQQAHIHANLRMYPSWHASHSEENIPLQ
jgi:hypothetical protein